MDCSEMYMVAEVKNLPNFIIICSQIKPQVP